MRSSWLRTFESIGEGMAFINAQGFDALPSYDPEASALLMRRVLDVLARV
jgi:hypothetical protein